LLHCWRILNVRHRDSLVVEARETDFMAFDRGPAVVVAAEVLLKRLIVPIESVLLALFTAQQLREASL